LLLVIPLLSVLFSRFVQERIGTILLSALIAHSAWHWMLERGTTFSEYQLAMPIVDSIFLASLMRWAMLLLIIAGAVWAMYEVFRRFALIEPLSSYGPSDNRSDNLSDSLRNKKTRES